MKKIGRIIFLFVVLVSGLTLAGCYKEDRYTFTNSIYSYNGDSVLFYDQLYIDDINMTLIEISKEEYLLRNNENVIQNQVDLKCYEVNFNLKFNDEELASQYSFSYLGEINDRSDGYKILLNLDNENKNLKADLTIILHFFGTIGGSTTVGEPAGRVNIVVIGNEINGIDDNSDYFNFPSTLYIEEGL